MLRATTYPARTSLRLARALSTTAAARKDPWPLPHTPEHLARTASPPDAPPPAPLPRAGESVATLRARLTYQARKRGTLESDLLLSTFAKEQLPVMSEAELREFDKVRGLLRWTQRMGADACNSLWTSRTGISIIGRRARGRLLNGGATLLCWRSCRSTQRTRARLYGACPTCHDVTKLYWICT